MFSPNRLTLSVLASQKYTAACTYSVSQSVTLSRKTRNFAVCRTQGINSPSLEAHQNNSITYNQTCSVRMCCTSGPVYKRNNSSENTVLNE